MPAGFVVHSYRVTHADGGTLDDDGRGDLLAALPYRIRWKIEPQIVARFTTPETLEVGHAPDVPLEEIALRAIVEHPFTFSLRLFHRAATEAQAKTRAELGDLAPDLACDPGMEWLRDSEDQERPPQLYLVDDAASAGFAARSVAETEVQQDSVGQCVVYVRAVSDAADEFERWTGAHVGDQIGFELDGRVLEIPTINEALPGEFIVFAGHPGGFREREATSTAAYIRVARDPPRIERIE